VHQHSVVGHYAIVGASAAATRNVRPFTRLVPGQPVTVNTYAIERYGFEEHRDEIERYVRERRRPDSDRIGAMVDEYERLHAASGRGEHA
jgi:UDP-N-acetylglucosamine acyltransferase